jgi:hypothetical protein
MSADLLRRAAAKLREHGATFELAVADLLQVLSWFPSQADPTDLTAASVVAHAVLREDGESR